MTTTIGGMSRGLAAHDRKKLAAILAMLSSDFEQERATAGRMATDFIRRHNLTWHDVAALAEGENLGARSSQSGRPPADPPKLMMPERWTANRACWRGYERARCQPSGQVLDRLI